jgi:hypothetical protein
MSPIPTHPPVRVFIAGGSYAGLSSALSLVDLAEGLTPRVAREPHVHHPDLPKFDVEITMVDERDGFCTCMYFFSPPENPFFTPHAKAFKSDLRA